MKVSAVIRTTGEREKLPGLERLVSSLSKQSLQNFEVILGTETNGEKIEGVMRDFFEPERFKVIETGAWNRCVTTNIGIKKSNGEFVAILEDDITLPKKWLEETVEILLKDGGDIAAVFSSFDVPSSKSFKKRRGFIGRVANLVGYLGVDRTVLSRLRKKRSDGLVEVPTITISCTVFRRETLFEVGLYDVKLTEPLRGDDYELGFRIHKKGYKILKTDSVKAIHHADYGSKREERDPGFFENFFRTEMYSYAKHWDLFGLYLIPQSIELFAEAFAKLVRTKKLSIIPKGFRGIITRLAEGLEVYNLEEKEDV